MLDFKMQALLVSVCFIVTLVKAKSYSHHRFGLPSVDEYKLFHRLQSVSQVTVTADCWIVVKADKSGAPPEKFIKLAQLYVGPVMFGLVKSYAGYST